MLNRTEEQEAIVSLAHAKENLQIVAYAGTGKTATLRMLAEEIEGPKLYVAFNKRIIEEALEGFPAECRTLNSVGHRVWANTIPKKVTLDGTKFKTIFKEIVKGFSREDATTLWDNYSEIAETVSLAKAVGYIPEGIYRQARRLVKEEFWSSAPCRSALEREIVHRILESSIQSAYLGNISFDDQLYMPTLFGGAFPRFPTVFVDEAQDLNPVNHLMVEKLARAGRLIAVGDPFQSIYGFRGAMQDGMGIQQVKHKMGVKTLSVSFRCKSEIVKNAQWRVKDFKWHRIGGSVRQLERVDAASFQDGSAIICRNNAPLFTLALRLLSVDRPCRVAGSDIGPKLVTALRRLGDPSLSRSAVLRAIDVAWGGKDTASAKDMAECMRVFANSARTLAEAIARAEFVLRQDGSITLLTGHKAKGLEWDTVYHLDPWLIGEGEQEDNLRYVIQTRARERYYEINSKGIEQ